jgi:hypothetical protein
MPTDLNEQKCCREKYWSEMNDSEKVDHLKREVQYMQNHIKTLTDFVSKLITHSHLEGKMVSPIEHPSKYDWFNFRVSEFK